MVGKVEGISGGLNLLVEPIYLERSHRDLRWDNKEHKTFTHWLDFLRISYMSQGTFVVVVINLFHRFRNYSFYVYVRAT